MSQVVVLHTAAHTAKTTPVAALWSSRTSTTQPDRAPSDCYLFGLFRSALRGYHFASDHELKEVVHTWLADKSENTALKAYQSLCNTGPSVLKSRATMLKHDALVSS